MAITGGAAIATGDPHRATTRRAATMPRHASIMRLATTTPRPTGPMVGVITIGPGRTTALAQPSSSDPDDWPAAF